MAEENEVSTRTAGYSNDKLNKVVKLMSSMAGEEAGARIGKSLGKIIGKEAGSVAGSLIENLDLVMNNKIQEEVEKAVRLALNNPDLKGTIRKDQIIEYAKSLASSEGVELNRKYYDKKLAVKNGRVAGEAAANMIIQIV